MTDVVVEGSHKTVVCFQWRCSSVDGYGEDITDLNTVMGELL